MNWSAYPEYSKSEVQWLQDLPTQWAVRNPKTLFTLHRERSRDGDRQLTASQSEGVVYQDEYMESRGTRVVQVIEGQAGLKHVSAGDFVISLRSFQGGIEWSAVPGKISPAYTVLTPRLEVVERFFVYLLKSSGFVQELRSTSNQLRDGQSLGFDHFAQVPVPLPPTAEQERIASFLDRETTKIDALIGKQEQLIATLREDRTATITHAVTKGLDPNEQMKDSGVEWLGAIPVHWEVHKGTRIGMPFGSESIAENEVDHIGDIPFLKVSSLHPEGLYPDSPVWFVSKEYRSKKNFIVFPKRGAAIFGNKVNIVRDHAVLDPNLMGWKLASGNLLEFFAQVLKLIRLEEIADVSSVPQINTKHLASLRLPRPPLAEQRAIVAALEERCGKIDALIAKANDMIETLREYRSALITDAVTGKIDVREVV
ncbi:restriction endonuclease subunit S [Rhodococcus sp. IEGM 248]|nr:restriction endonuclease subunit S [Rhodococcus sp. IEGM 248]